jgi:hypothetical protein
MVGMAETYQARLEAFKVELAAVLRLTSPRTAGMVA